MLGGQHHVYNRHQVSSSSESSSSTSVYDQEDVGFTGFLKRHCQPAEEKPHHHSGRHLQDLLRNLGRKVLILWARRGDIRVRRGALTLGEYEVFRLWRYYRV
jgi:hypothetical protein